MNIILLLLLLSILLVQANTENCEASRELESNCANYCYNVVRPLLDHTKVLQSQVHSSMSEKKLERSECLIEEKIEQKLDNFDKKLSELRLIMEAKQSVFGASFQRIGSKYYYIEQYENLNWFGAVHKCLALGGQLVSIKNESEFNAIVAKLQPSTHYWIDINDLATEGVFLSVATGLRATYYNWHNNNPDNYRNLEHCGELWYHENKHLMNDGPCNHKKFFICEPHNQ